MRICTILRQTSNIFQWLLNAYFRYCFWFISHYNKLLNSIGKVAQYTMQTVYIYIYPTGWIDVHN